MFYNLIFQIGGKEFVETFFSPGKCGHNMISKEEIWTESAFYVTLFLQAGLQPKNI